MDAVNPAQGLRGTRSPSEGRRRATAWRALWILSPLTYVALYLTRGAWPDVVLAAFGLGAVVLLPGWLLHQLIMPRPRIGLVARLAYAFMLGVAIVSVLGLIAWLCGGDTRLGPVTAGDGAPPRFPGSLGSILWGEAAFLFVGGIVLVLRDALGRGARRSRRERAVMRATGTDAGVAVGVADVSAAGAAPPASGPVRATRERDREPEDHWQRILRRAYQLSDEQKTERRIAPRWASVIMLAVLIVATSLLSFHAGGNLGFRTDSPDHISCLREMVERDRILPRTTFYADGDGATVDPRKGFFHVALALVARLTALDPVRLWQLLPGLLAPLALVVFHTLARRILRSDGTALFATFLAVVCFGDVNRGLFARLAYGNTTGIVLGWGALALALRFVRGDPRPGMLWLIGLAAFGATATHAFAAVAILFPLGVFLLAMGLARGTAYRGTRRLALALLAAFAGLAVPMLWRVLFASGSLNPIHTHRQGVLYLSRQLFVISPQEWGAYLGGVGFAGVLLSLALWRRVDEGDGVLYLATLSLAPMLVLLNPLVVPLLEPWLGYLVARFALLVPFLAVFAYVAGWMGQALLDLHSTRRVVKALLFYALMVWLLFPRFESFARSYSTANLDNVRSRSILVWQDLMTRLDRELPGPAVILSDPVSGYCIPALTRHRTVAVLHQHGSPADSLALERLAGARDVLSPYIGTGEKARICRRFGVDYVLVNAEYPRPIDLFECHTGPERAALQKRVLDEDTILFRKLWDIGPAGALYAVRAENLDRLSGIVRAGEETPLQPTTETRSAAIVLRSPPGHALPVLPDTTAGIALAAVALDSSRVSPGGRLGITLYWRRVDVPARFPVITYARLETQVPHGRFWIERFSKLSRLLVERRRHLAYRFEETHTPLEGMFGCEHWPRDRYVADRMLIDVPERVARSSYTLKLKWVEETFLPNLPLTHFVSDDDAYEGAAVGVVEVY